MDQAHPILASCFPSFVTVKSVQNVLPPFIVFYEVIIKSISQCQMNYMVYWSILFVFILVLDTTGVTFLID